MANTTKGINTTYCNGDQTRIMDPVEQYQEFTRQIRDIVDATLPPEANVIVVSKGDDELLKLHGRPTWHFPCLPDGTYAGCYPATGAEAISYLESLRAKGGEYLLLPSTGLWWLEFYREFKQHLEGRYRVVVDLPETCLIFALCEPPAKHLSQSKKPSQCAEPATVSTLLEMDNLPFQCNICGQHCVVKLETLKREDPSCHGCRSTLRLRAIIHALSVELFGESLLLSDFPTRREMAGLGMTDWDRYAVMLERKFDYQNTYYDREPRLDIAAIEPGLERRFDFIISSEVFEHVVPPVSKAFENARSLLKPDGVLILSVPYIKEGRTIEHFPELYRYSLEKTDGRYILKNVTREGVEQFFENLIFHGPRSALEMRVFSETSLVDEAKRAGFNYINFYETPVFEHGIYWKEERSLPLALRTFA